MNKVYWIMWHGQFIPHWLLWAWIILFIFAFIQTVLEWDKNVLIIGRIIMNALCYITMFYLIRNMWIFQGEILVNAPGYHLLSLLSIPSFFIALHLTLHKSLINMLFMRLVPMGWTYALLYTFLFAMP